MISGLTHEARRIGREERKGRKEGEGRKEMEREGGKEEEGKKGEEKIEKLNGTEKPFNLTKLTQGFKFSNF